MRDRPDLAGQVVVLEEEASAGKSDASSQPAPAETTYLPFTQPATPSRSLRADVRRSFYFDDSTDSSITTSSLDSYSYSTSSSSD